MTNEEWLRCSDPVTMIKGLEIIASGRKGCLFLCGCCRLVWDLLYDEASKEAVQIVERYADGSASHEDLKTAAWLAECATFEYSYKPSIWREWGTDIPDSVRNLVRLGVLTELQLEEDEPQIDPIWRDRLMTAAQLAARAVCQRPFDNLHWTDKLRVISPKSSESLLRCIFGKPFLPAIIPNPAWVTSNVVTHAGTIYDEKAFDRMPLLGDALEEAGCNNEDILSHCRSRNPHSRGCWVVDLVLGKK